MGFFIIFETWVDTLIYLTTLQLFEEETLLFRLVYLIDMKPRRLPRCDFTLPMLPCFCSAKIGKIFKKIKKLRNI